MTDVNYEGCRQLRGTTSQRRGRDHRSFSITWQLRKELLQLAHALVDGRALFWVLRKQKHKGQAVVMLEGLRGKRL